MKPELFKKAPEDTVPVLSDSGFINKELFAEWLQHFAKYAKPTEDKPVFLIVDKHMPNCSLEAVTFCREQYITMLSVPVHSCQKLQPLDRGIFGSLKQVYDSDASKWIHNP
jgi:hypothetical protein